MNIAGDDIDADKLPEQPPPATDDVAQLLHYLPIITRASDISDWTRQFCISIAARMKRGPVNPTQKQIAVMRKIVAEFKAATMGDDVVERP
jgi:hypothetical protein